MPSSHTDRRTSIEACLHLPAQKGRGDLPLCEQPAVDTVAVKLSRTSVGPLAVKLLDTYLSTVQCMQE